MLHVPWAQTKALQYSFAVNGPNIWNSLPAALQMLDSCLVSFMHNLRTHLTMTAWPPTGALVSLQYCCARYNLDTYLLTYFAFYICSSVLFIPATCHHNENEKTSSTRTYLKCLDIFQDVLALQHVWNLHLFHFLSMKFNTTANTD